MTIRHLPVHVERWRRDGVAPIERFFGADEVAGVRDDFVRVFGRTRGAETPMVKTTRDEIGRFNAAQFTTFDAVPFDCSPALNLVGVHPALIEFARAALQCDAVSLYQCQAWAKFTGDADYAQPFHCDYVNHTLTAPAEDAAENSIAILCYFSDVTEAHGPMHYVPRAASAAIAGPEATLAGDAALQAALREHARSSAAPAGSIVAYGIDVFHRGTNMTAPGGHRFAVMACYKRAGNDAIGYHAWPFHHTKPWHRIFDHATPTQLECFGVRPPGDPFWTETTLRRAQARYPNWDLTPYRAALR